MITEEELQGLKGNIDVIVSLIKAHSKKTPKWVDTARADKVIYNALVNGVDFNKVLIERIEKIENKDKSVAREKYSKNITDLFHRTYQKRDNVFNSFGGSIVNELNSKTLTESFIKFEDDFKGQKSVSEYLEGVYFNLCDVDPNGVIFIEYKEDKDIYPTYKSIDDIRVYKSNGQLLDFILFEPKTIVVGNSTHLEWRFVDSKYDYTIKNQGDTFDVLLEKSFKHPFNSVPAFIVSSYQDIGSELRKSHVLPIIELAKDYARDKSIKTIYKFQNGFTRHWMYGKNCNTCRGSGIQKDGECPNCKGAGTVVKDVTDINILPIPRADANVLNPVEGFTAPDLETWGQYNKEQVVFEDIIKATAWNIELVTGNETATGRFIDLQPIITKLNRLTNDVEWGNNIMYNFILQWLTNGATETGIKKLFGRRFIIESLDVLLEKYAKGVSDGLNSVVLDKLLEEVVSARFQNNPDSLAIQTKKATLEPYVHNTLETVNTIFGKVEAEKKIMFSDFWKQADTSKDIDKLKTEMEAYFISNTKIKEEPIKIEKNE